MQCDGRWHLLGPDFTTTERPVIFNTRLWQFILACRGHWKFYTCPSFKTDFILNIISKFYRKMRSAPQRRFSWNPKQKNEDKLFKRAKENERDTKDGKTETELVWNVLTFKSDQTNKTMRGKLFQGWKSASLVWASGAFLVLTHWRIPHPKIAK